LYAWKREYPDLAEAMKRGKEAFDTKVVESGLLKRATGYECDEITTVRGKGVKVVIKLMAPDVAASIFWLKNRNPRRWRDAQHQIVSAEPPQEITIGNWKKQAPVLYLADSLSYPPNRSIRVEAAPGRTPRHFLTFP